MKSESRRYMKFGPKKRFPVFALIIFIVLIMFLSAGLLFKDRIEETGIVAKIFPKNPASAAGPKSQVPERAQKMEKSATEPVRLRESGFISRKLDDEELALELKRINNLIALDDKNANAFYNRGWLYEYKGKTEKAVKDYTRAITLAGYHADAYYNRGLIYIKQEKYELAVKDFNEVIRNRQEDADAYNNRGNAYVQMGKLEPALHDYNTALRLNPDDPDLYYNRGVVYRSLGENKKARHDFQKAAEMGHKQAGELLGRL